MASFQTLSYDLIYFIFGTDYISFSDLLQLSSVCQVFNCVASSNGLWRSKFKKRWPHCEKSITSTSENWKTLFKWRYYCERKVREKLSDLATDCYHVENMELEDVEDLYQLVDKHHHNLTFILDELNSYRRSQRRDNLTEKFYASRVWRGMKLLRLKSSCVKFIEDPDSFTLFESTVLACNWFEQLEFPQIAKFRNAILELSDLAVERLKSVYPKHPVITQYKRVTRNESSLNQGKQINLTVRLSSNLRGGTINWPTKSFWGTGHCKEVLESIHKIMFGYLDFQIDDTDADCFLINKVAKGRGTKDLVAIVFSAVAYCLGVFAQPIILTGSCIEFLKWQPNPDRNPGEVYYVDVKDDWISKHSNFIFKNYMLTSDDLVIRNPQYQPLMVFSRVLFKTLTFHYHSFYKHYNHLRVALGHIGIPLHFIKSFQFPRALDLYHIIFQNLATFLLNVCDPQPKTIVCLIQATIPNEAFPKRQKRRSSSATSRIKYAIGMVMSHRWELYRCVIYSWDFHPSEEWRKLFQLARSRQPHYRVLLDNEIVKYVPEEDLEIDDENRPIRSLKVGKYFQSFHGSYYAPNKMAQSVYPDDDKIRRRLLDYN